MQEQSTAIEPSAYKIKKVCLNDGGAYDHDLKVCPFCNWKLVEVDKVSNWLKKYRPTASLSEDDAALDQQSPQSDLQVIQAS